MRGAKQRAKRLGGARSLAMAAAGLVAPTPERLQHGAVTRRSLAIEDLAGHNRTTLVWRGLGTLETMAAKGSITPAMALAGGHFHDHFRRAGLDGLYAADPTRAPVQLAGGGMWAAQGGNEAARLQIASALDALGGIQSPGGSCAWHVLGCEMSLRRWATHSTWSQRRVDHAVAAGILIADLGILQAHWDF